MRKNFLNSFPTKRGNKKMLFEHKNFLILSNRENMPLVYKTDLKLKKRFLKSECGSKSTLGYISIGIFKSSVVGFVIL
ncbi:hypothetical protein DQM68_11260 [Leptospira mayottensis]|uniref:Uncharacterized protein n=2 Tax=Leptospira mayottensis TaxID=1137606 RepID=A0AA87SUX7_9LEPT|nr:hypothetical protein DQM68_11260 [Leptospira mayottensis]AXR66230.1 hypothetical protein DQM28_16480 [Leptospira mayottensis]AZQ03805.1 hypothetical protein LEP1GSC190_10445 [Leptospira mayottensis 200901116]EKR98470.1 hypothetical protein LEP1GSC125_1676 [Leptospira mayottensis 200901122]TGN16886.1 hypothetical protein EHR03_03065 [Leptospira mayottensis]